VKSEVLTDTREWCITYICVSVRMSCHLHHYTILPHLFYMPAWQIQAYTVSCTTHLISPFWSIHWDATLTISLRSVLSTFTRTLETN